MHVPDPEFERLLREEELARKAEREKDVPIKIGRLYAWRAFSMQGSEWTSGDLRYDKNGQPYWYAGQWGKLDLYPLVHTTAVPYSLIGVNDYRDMPPDPNSWALREWDTSVTESNHAGFWAFSRKSEALRYMRRESNEKTTIYGLVELSGETIVYDNGYRSEFLEILALVSFANAKARRAIAHKLGWPGKIHPTSWGQDFYPFQEER